MSVLRSIESKIEGLFEGVFGRAFRTHVQPVELARKLAKEMDEHRSVSVSRVYAPNEYTVYLSPPDRAQFASYEGSLIGELQEYLAEHARREGYALLTPPRVLVTTDDDLAIGEFGIATRLTEIGDAAAPSASLPPGPTPPAPAQTMPPVGMPPVAAPVAAQVPTPPPAPVVEPAQPLTMVYRPVEPLAADDPPPAEVARESVCLVIGDRVVPISTARVVLGRSRECDVQLDDANASRRHCEIAQDGAASWSITDLGSTNGTEVNGRRVDRAPLADGDRITVGGTVIVFDRSLR
ncbi:MAG: FhaA domain-containing protein [Gaiella sp.]